MLEGVVRDAHRNAVLRALAVWAGEAKPTAPAGRRQLWDWAGVLVDDLASLVLVLGLRTAQDSVVAAHSSH